MAPSERPIDVGDLVAVEPLGGEEERGARVCRESGERVVQFGISLGSEDLALGRCRFASVEQPRYQRVQTAPRRPRLIAAFAATR